jgi:hypothetical protein
MLKNLTPKTSILALASGSLMIALVGTVLSAPKIVDWIEAWQSKAQLAIEE